MLPEENKICENEPVEETIPKYVHPLQQPQAEENLATHANTFDSEKYISKIEILKFSGVPTKYFQFIKTFEVNVERVIEDANHRLLLLIQHCEGEARKLIEFCLMLDPQKGYRQAKSILNDNFGRRNQIARAFIDKHQQRTGFGEFSSRS